MKKLLIATAALAMVAGTAQAQSSVTVYGIMDIGVSDASQKTSVNGRETQKSTRSSTGNGDGALSTSRLGFRGTEDLGGGNKANFVLEYDLNDVGAGGGSTGTRYSWVGLESQSAGQVRLGRQESSAHSVVVGGSAGMANNVAGAMYSGNQGPDMANAISVRPHAVFVDKAITYISPNFGGLTAEVQTGKLKDSNSVNGVETIDKAEIAGASLKFASGKFTTAYAYQQVKRSDTIVGATLMTAASAATDGTAAKGSAHMLNATYDFGIAKVFALHAKDKGTTTTVATGARTADEKATTTEIGVQVPVGKTLLWASMFDGSAKNNLVANRQDFDTKGYQVGARYDLSKRTNLYAIYGTQEIKGGAIANPNTKAEATGIAAGVRHSF